MIATVSLVACGGNDTQEIDKSIMPAADSNKSLTPANAATNFTTDQGTGVTSMPVPQTVGGAQTMPATQAPAAGLNPAHGAPGHRCDIAVGAPLNSAPAASATQPQVQTAPAPSQTISTPAPAPANSITAAGLNPPHGQPGHDCAIAVGAPLKKS